MDAAERSSFAPMTLSTDGPNPLRPYYRPSSVGLNANAGGSRIDTAATAARNHSSNFRSSYSETHPVSFGSSARDILSDLDYTDSLRELSGQSNFATAKNVLDQAVWKYSSIFMAQPFELAKMVLQVRLAPDVLNTGVKGSNDTRRRGSYGYPNSHDDEEDDDEPSYFTSTTPVGLQGPMSPLSPSLRSRRSVSRSASGLSSIRSDPSPPPVPAHMLDLKARDSLMEVISQLWSKEGAWGIWKGTNATFLYTLLFKTFETWTRNMLSAVFNLPDPGIGPGSGGGVGGLDIIDSPSPLTSLFIIVTAAGVSGLILSPLDVVRTRLMLTATSEQPRSILPCLRDLPSWVCPPSLFAPTLLHSIIPSLVSASTPLVLRSSFQIDPIITPATYSVSTFLSSTFELFIKLPLETVLRRGQIKHVMELSKSSSITRSGRSRRHVQDHHSTDKVMTVVDVGPYYGVVNTMWHVARDEGESVQTVAVTTRGAPPGTPAKKNNHITSKGQGVHGLWRGWRVGWWGLVGIWGAAALGGGAKGGEF